MTATPIPRTAAMTVYGDLDQTVLDELPVGRTPVETVWLDGPERYRAAWDKVRAEIAAGHQAYVICPLVGVGQPEDEEPEGLDEGDDSEPPVSGYDGDRAEALQITDSMLPFAGFGLGPLDAPKPPPKSVVEEFARLCAGELAGFAVGLLHGQLASKEKEATMSRVPPWRSPGSRCHNCHRGRGRCRQGDRHGDRGCRPFRDRPASSAPRQGRAGDRQIVVLPPG